MSPTPQGFGLGLRTENHRDFIDHRPAADWVEVLSENYMVPGGKLLHMLEAIRRDYAMVMRGASLSIGSTDPLDLNYLHDLLPRPHCATWSPRRQAAGWAVEWAPGKSDPLGVEWAQIAGTERAARSRNLSASAMLAASTGTT